MILCFESIWHGKTNYYTVYSMLKTSSLPLDIILGDLLESSFHPLLICLPWSPPLFFYPISPHQEYNMLYVSEFET